MTKSGTAIFESRNSANNGLNLSSVLKTARVPYRMEPMRFKLNNLLSLAAVTTLILTACTAIAQEEAKPTPDAQAPAKKQAEPQADAKVVELLKKIEASSAKLDTLTTRVRYTRLQGLTGDEQRRFGDFYYAAGSEKSPTRFAVMFDRLIIDERARPMKAWFIFDGNWMLERDHDDKTAVRRELVPKGAERPDVLNMGDKQMSIPLKLKANTVLSQYKVQQLEDTPLGEQTLHHLKLTPRKGGDKAEPMDLWFDSKTLLLQKVLTEEDGDEIELLFPTPKINPDIATEVFDTKLPDKEDGWQVQEVPIEG